MKVLVISNDKSVFESGSAVERRLVALAEKAGDITVIVPATENCQKRLSSRLVAYGVSGNKVSKFFKMIRLGSNLLKKSRFDLITVQDTAYLALLAYILKKKCVTSEGTQMPLEVQVHGFEKFAGLRKMLASFILRRADKIRAVSVRLESFLTSNFKLEFSRLYILPIYTQVVRIICEEKAKAKGRPFTFLTISRLVPVKNVELQIEVFAKFAKKYPDSRLVVVGSGPLEESLKSQVQSLELENKVSLEGDQRYVGEYYENSDVFLLTSDSEGWGVAAVEAAAYGLPVIMTDVGLAGEFIINGKNGIVVPLGDEKSLFDAMEFVYTDEELRLKLGQSARESFLELPDSSEYIEKQVSEWKKM